MALGSTQPLTVFSSSKLYGDKARPARKADLNAICDKIFLENFETSMRLNGLSQQ
jgi:hypothetical protein